MKRIGNLTIDELEKVFDANDKLQKDVADDYEESQMDYISDILDDLRSSLTDYSIGFYQHNFICYNNERDLFSAALQACKDYGFLPDKTAARIDYYLSRCDVLDMMDYDNKHYTELSEYIENAADETARTIEHEFNILTDYSENDLLDYFKEFYADERMDGDYYIDDNYILYQHIEYEKCYSSETKKRAAC